MSIDLAEIRSYFPILRQQVYGKPLVYLDSAATTQKVSFALEAEQQITHTSYGNIHRAAHFMADKATAAFEAVRTATAGFLNASEPQEIIFTKGTTESINLVAFSFGEAFVTAGDEIVVSQMEHHANIVPWQIMAERRGAKIIMWPVEADGTLSAVTLKHLISSRTRLIAVAHVSNVLGTINPVTEFATIARENGIRILIDGAQAVPHIAVDVQQLGADFYVFSPHKMYGPNGVGVLFGRRELLDAMPPYQGGGEMIEQVSFSGTQFNVLPFKFEAGTPNITGVIGFGAALRFMEQLGYAAIMRHEQELMEYALKQLQSVEGFQLYGPLSSRSGVVSFNIERVHPFDIGTLLDREGIAVRTGRHCADPLMDHLSIPGAVRISFGVYTCREEIDRFFNSLLRIVKMLGA